MADTWEAGFTKIWMQDVEFFCQPCPQVLSPTPLSLTPWGWVGENPGNGGSFFACLPAIQEIIMYQIYFFAANANQQGKHSLVSPMKARDRAAWL